MVYIVWTSKDKHMTDIAQTKQPNCQPVHDEFGAPGSPVDPTLMGPEFQDVAEDVAARLMADPTYTQTHDQRETANGRGALRVMHSVGCAACDLEQVCGVAGVLRTVSEEGEAAERREMLASAPRWLAAGRLHRAEIPSAKFDALLNDPNRLQILADMGKTLDDLLGGVRNEIGGLYHRDELPELSTFDGIPDERFASTIVTTSTGNTFSVIDTTEGGDQPASRNGYDSGSANEYVILCGKLLDRMIAVDGKGQPHVMSPDRIMQKIIKTTDAGTLFEMRMNGKDRLYFTVLPKPDGQDSPTTARIVIVGRHGGSGRTQQQFLLRLLGKS